MAYSPSFDRAGAAALWDFGGIHYMNHGSYGACPKPVQEFHRAQQAALRQSPVDYFQYETPNRVAAAREFWAGFTGTSADNIVLVDNATAGVNTVMKSLALQKFFRPGDEILLTSHGYNACNNIAREIAALTGAVVTIARIPFPIDDKQQVTDAVINAASPKTRLALIDHITSETALIFPIADIVAALKARNIETLVDGAHAPAHVDIGLDKLGAAFYTGNGHKWLCGALGAAFLYVRPDFQHLIRPLVTSHGANDMNPALSPFQKCFAWQGSRDVTPWFTPAVAFDTLSKLHAEGLRGLIADNRRLLRHAYGQLLDALKLKPFAPDDMLGQMATVLLPAGDAAALRHDLRQRDNFVTQLGPYSKDSRRIFRLSTAAYNQPGQYESLIAALLNALSREEKGQLMPLPES